MFCKYCGKENMEEAIFCRYCGEKIKKNYFFYFFKEKRFLLKIIVIILAIIFFGGMLASIILVLLGEVRDSTREMEEQKISLSLDQSKVISSIVNIYCKSTFSEEDSRGGSGTIIGEDGLILTNSHIIPQDENYLHIYEEGCLVFLPEPVTGYPEEVFWARPIVIPGLSDYYDLAFMEIYAPYYDEEEGVFFGAYSRMFPVYEEPTRCDGEYFQLGEPIRIYGYPELVSGGISLTITDGVISNFLEGGLIATSAKISPGNSGGLAVAHDGCIVGVPSMVISDDHERFGVIISTNLIFQFIEELESFYY